MREDVVLVELGKICNYSKGKKPKVLTKEYSEETPYPYINIKAFEHGIFDEYTDGSKCNLCEDGDLLMVWDGARAGFTGKAKKGAIGSTLMKVEPKKGIEKNYLFYFLLSLYKKLNTNPRGVGIPHVEPNLLWTSELIIPSLPEQRAIVQKIESYFALLDKGIADLTTAQEQLKTYRQAVLKKAFEGEFTNKNIKEGKLPEGWKWVKLGDVCEKAKKVKRSEKVGNESFLYLDITGIDNTINKIVNHKSFLWKDAPSRAQQIVKIGDTLFSTVRTYLKNIAKVESVIYENQICSSGFTVIRGRKEILDSKYIFHYVLSEKFLQPLNELQTGTSYPAVRDNDVFSQYIPLPPTLSEQHAIVREIESRLSVCDKVEQSISEALEKAEALRQSILKKAFEGGILSEAEITACKQEPDYEPASVLLERIKKEEKHGK
ncbi:MAG: hypothetical protein GX587_09755 [Bacteroidales bacterium]|jgi:type I restriction enzyme S subunit|nr:hypothetical protein [Bacteroidales bacterium]